MATIGTLLIGIRAKLHDSFHKETQKAVSWTDKLSNKLTNKLVGAGAAIRFLSHGIGTLTDNLQKMSEEGASAGEVLSGILEGLGKSIPFVGDSFVRLGQLIRSELDGSAAEMRALKEEAEGMQFENIAIEGRRLESIGKIMADLRNKVASIGQAKELFDLKQLGASETALRQAREHLEAIERAKASDTFKAMVNDLAAQHAELTGGAGAGLAYQLALQGLNDKQIELIVEMQRANDELREQQALMQRAAETAAEWQFQIENFGKTARELEIERLRLAGADEAQLERLRQLDEELKRLERRKELEAEAKRIIESTLTPYQRYLKEVEKLKELLEESLLTQEQFDAALKNAQDNLRAAMGGIRKLERPGAVEQRFTSNFPGADKIVDPIKELTKTEKSHFLETRKQTTIFSSIENILKNQVDEVVTF